MLLSKRLTVGEIAEACRIQSHVASEHLRLMERCRLFSSEREGRCVYYQVAEPHLADLMSCIVARFNNERENT